MLVSVQIEYNTDVRAIITEVEDQIEDSLSLSCSTHPDQNKWYKNSSPHFVWNKPKTVLGFSYILDDISSTVPDDISEGEASEKEYSGIVDGRWYFHLKALGDPSLTATLHYKLNIDTTPPEFDEVAFREGSSALSRRPTLQFHAEDLLSGIDYYQYAVDKDDFKNTESPLKIPHLDAGTRTVTLRVYDKAGNSNESKVKIEIIALATPKITSIKNTIAIFESQVIKGEGPKNNKLKIYGEGSFGQKFVWETKIDDKGKWRYTHLGVLAPGEIKVYTVAFGNLEGESEKSDEKEFTVLSGTIYLFSYRIPIWAGVLLIILILAVIRYLSRFAPAVLSPRLKNKKIFVIASRGKEFIALEKYREISTDPKFFELPWGEVPLGEDVNSATKELIGKVIPSIGISIKNKIDFFLDEKKSAPASFVFATWDKGDIEIDREQGYVGFWLLDQDKIDDYLNHFPSKSQKMVLKLFKKSLEEKNKD